MPKTAQLSAAPSPNAHWQLLIGALGVVGVTAWAYAVAFFFEWGYFFHFNIPFEYVQIQQINLVIAVLAVACLCMTLMIYGIVILKWSIGKKLTERKAIIATFAIMSFLFIFLPFAVGLWKFAIFMLLYLTVAILLLLYALKQMKGKNVEKKLAKIRKHPLLNDSFEALEKILRIETLATMFLVLLTLGFSFSIGKGIGQFKETFQTMKIAGRELIILRLYDQTAIALPLEQNNKMLSPEIFVLDAQNITEDGAGIRLKKFGQLQTKSIE